MTTTSSQANQIGRTWTFSTDSSDGVYTVTAGSGESWTISPAFGGSTNSGLTITSTGGNWPVKAIHDVYRHFLKYSTSLWGIYALHATQAQTDYLVGDTRGPAAFGQVNGLPGVVAYEGQIQTIDPNGVPALAHDLWYDSAMADTYATFLQSMQDGSPLQANSGLNFVTIFHLGGGWGGGSEAALWSTIIWGGQTWGSGVSNLYSTPQGGSPGDGKCYDVNNQSVELTQQLAWYAAANPSTASPPSFASATTTEQSDTPVLSAAMSPPSFASAATTEQSDTSVLSATMLSYASIVIIERHDTLTTPTTAKSPSLRRWFTGLRRRIG